MLGERTARKNYDDMTDEEFAALVEAGRERRNLEYKQSGSWTDAAYKTRIVKAILALTNIRDGGWVVIGMAEQQGAHVAQGVMPADLKTIDEQTMQDGVGEYAAPYVSFTVETRTYGAAQFVLISVREFEEVPVICKKEFSGVLRRGATYVRSRGRRPESVEVSNEADMREVLELAIDKGVQRLRRRGYVQLEPNAHEAYDEEARDIL